MNIKIILILSSVTINTSCAQFGTVDPLGSTVLQKRDPEHEYTPDLKVQAGYICRELMGQVTVSDIQGSGTGARCQQIGKESMTGCMQWERPGFKFESPGCKPPAPAVSPELVKQLEELSDRLKAVEIDNQEIRDDFVEDYYVPDK